ncbi:comm domain-containing protein 9 [Chrysochromulina tobinii]|uniref:Comm domain-containing protein 9 n=1 Tax=Chrysochromulina tobinii TaxID=1460289 RepID=A0A0M0LRR0_9EUKA|nr:comm domain-containing protein 9 [Chrysochromulina tobinii]|eukprot:KOO53671.1 comm domain-containing protein 9 [Chrysochromulina sp. CCMP291]
MSAEGGSSPLLLLLKATSKQAIDEFLCACNVERELLKGPGAARIADLAASFGITEVEATQLQQAGANLVTEAVYRRAADAEKIATLFGDLPETEEAQQLQKLLGRVLLHRYEQFRAESLALGGVSTMPKLNQMSWQVYRKPAANGSSVAVPAMLLSLVLGEGPGKAAKEVNVEMSKEQLEAMLASLSKVKEQARALGASHSQHTCRLPAIVLAVKKPAAKAKAAGAAGSGFGKAGSSLAVASGPTPEQLLKKAMQAYDDIEVLKNMQNKAEVGASVKEILEGGCQAFPSLRKVPRETIEYAFESLDSFEKHVYEGLQGRSERRADAARTLGIESGASMKEIKMAHRKFMQQLHPDMFIGDEAGAAKASEQMHKVQEAYQELGGGQGSANAGSFYQRIGGKARVDFSGALSKEALAPLGKPRPEQEVPYDNGGWRVGVTPMATGVTQEFVTRNVVRSSSKD